MGTQTPPADPRLWADWSRATYGDTSAIELPKMGAPRPNTEQHGDGFSGFVGGGTAGGGASGGMRGAFESSIMDTINHPGLSEHDVESKINAGTEGIALGEQGALHNTQNKAESMGIGGGAVSAANRETLSDYAGQRADFARNTRTDAANDASQQRLGALNAGANYYGKLDDNARQDRDALINFLSSQRNTSSSSGGSMSQAMQTDYQSNAPTGAPRHGGVAGPAENGPVMMQKAFSQPEQGGGGGGEGGGGGDGPVPPGPRLRQGDPRGDGGKMGDPFGEDAWRNLPANTMNSNAYDPWRVTE